MHRSIVFPIVFFLVLVAFTVAPHGHLPESVTLNDGTTALIHRNEQWLYLQDQQLGGTFGKAMIYEGSGGQLMAHIDIASRWGNISPSLPADEKQKQKWHEVFGNS